MAELRDIPSEYRFVGRILLFNVPIDGFVPNSKNGKVETIRNPMTTGGTGMDDGRFGPEVGILHVRPGDTVIKVVMGGSSITQWNEALVASALNAVNAMKERIHTIFWLQGEADSASTANVAVYPARLAQLQTTLRANEFLRESKFVSAHVKVSSFWPLAPMLNDVLDAMSSETVPTADLQTFDNAHYDAASMLTLGERLGETVG